MESFGFLALHHHTSLLFFGFIGESLTSSLPNLGGIHIHKNIPPFRWVTIPADELKLHLGLEHDSENN